MSIKLSIIIACYNKINFTKRAIEDLLHLDPNSVEIIMIDNGSVDETKNYLQSLNKTNIKCIFNEQNNWHSGACNQGFAISKGDSVLLLNNDIKIQDKSGWADILIKEIEANPNCLVGPTGGFVDTKNKFQFMYETIDPNKQINYISGWCFGAKKETWNKFKKENCAGPLDEINFPFYFNDTNLCFEAKNLYIDLKLIKLPIQHIGKVSSSQLNVYSLYNDARKKFVEKWNNKYNDITK